MLILDFNIVTDKSCAEFVFSEKTGSYNSIKKPGGWGAPNPTIASATLPTLSVTFPGATASVNYVLSSSFPTTDPSIEQIVTNVNLGLGSTVKFTDGKHKIKYSVTTGGFTYTREYIVFVYCNVSCCINKMIAKISDATCKCDDDFIDKALLATTLLHGLEYAAICQQEDKFANILKLLKALCDDTPCDC